MLSNPSRSGFAALGLCGAGDVDSWHGAWSGSFATLSHHALLQVRMQREAIAAKKARTGLAKDDEWEGDSFVKQSESMVAN